MCNAKIANTLFVSDLDGTLLNANQRISNFSRETLNRLIGEYNVKDKVELGGTFCMGKCQQSVCVAIEDEIFSVSPDTAESFFKNEVMVRL